MGRIRARAVGGELTLLVHLAPREKLDDTLYEQLNWPIPLS